MATVDSVHVIAVRPVVALANKRIVVVLLLFSVWLLRHTCLVLQNILTSFKQRDSKRERAKKVGEKEGER